MHTFYIFLSGIINIADQNAISRQLKIAKEVGFKTVRVYQKDIRVYAEYPINQIGPNILG